MTIPKGDFFRDVARDALCTAEGVICEGDSSATLSPSVASIEDIIWSRRIYL